MSGCSVESVFLKSVNLMIIGHYGHQNMLSSSEPLPESTRSIFVQMVYQSNRNPAIHVAS